MALQGFTLIQSPMAGGTTTAELVSGACRAGALGSIGAGYLSGQAVEEEIKAVRAKGADAFAVNLFIPASRRATAAEWQRARQALEPCYQAAGVAMPEQFKEQAPFDEQFEAVLEARPAFFTFTFGRLPKDLIKACRARGVALIGTATSRNEALALADDGVDAIVLQGEEAGGHCGSANPHAAAQPLATLLAECRDIDKPLIAAGGIMDGVDLARAMEQGAAAGQLGTAFLRCPEAGCAEVWKQAIATAEPGCTALTLAVSGRYARGIANAWMDQRAPADPAPYPDQNRLTSPLRKAAGVEWKSLWAGTGVHRSRALPVVELVAAIEAERRA